MENRKDASAGSALESIKIVLVGTTHPGNIGATARAMKVMGLQQLCLVAPKTSLNAESYALAAGADDILDHARVFASLADALADCATVYGTTARERSLPWPIISPRKAADNAITATVSGEVAFVFGAEHSGLSNDEVSLCRQLIRIPSAQDFSSLNLAQAVQVCAYELCVSARKQSVLKTVCADEDPPARHKDTERLYDHWTAVMTTVDYLFPDNPRLLPQRVRRMLAKAEFTVTETQIFRGFLAAVEKALKSD